jgi:glyoxylase-like metal-dependent hydrolase (beta-lactamase superfamily II)
MPYDVFAIKYAQRDARRPEHFIGGDPHDGAMPMDYFVWAIVGDGRMFVVDTGFERPDAEARARTLLRTASEAVSLIGVDAGSVPEVILTHVHYDHAGGIGQFPGARFHVQDREMAYATGRHMTKPVFSHAFTGRHIADLVLAVHDQRVTFHDGDAVLAPGVTVHLIGGHTDGLQAVRIETDRGPVVLASDATHYYENMQTGRPFPIVFNVGAMVVGWDRLRELAGDGVVVPGHDPLVFQRFPAADPALAGAAVRIEC